MWDNKKFRRIILISLVCHFFIFLLLSLKVLLKVPPIENKFFEAKISKEFLKNLIPEKKSKEETPQKQEITIRQNPPITLMSAKSPVKSLMKFFDTQVISKFTGRKASEKQITAKDLASKATAPSKYSRSLTPLDDALKEMRKGKYLFIEMEISSDTPRMLFKVSSPYPTSIFDMENVTAGTKMNKIIPIKTNNEIDPDLFIYSLQMARKMPGLEADTNGEIELQGRTEDGKKIVLKGRLAGKTKGTTPVMESPMSSDNEMECIQTRIKSNLYRYEFIVNKNVIMSATVEYVKKEEDDD